MHFMKIIRKIIKNILPFYFVKKYLNYVERKNDFKIEDVPCEQIADSSFGKNILKITRKDCKFPFLIRSETTDIHVYNAIFKEEQYKFSVKRDPEIIIDAGANIGLSTIFFANKYPDAKIIAIEPEESNYKLLKKNTENYSTITTIKAALWNSVGEIDLFDTGRGNWGFSVATPDGQDQVIIPGRRNRHLTKTITIGKIIADYSIGEIDILKIDIEGAEKEVFGNSAGWIEKVNSIIAELHDYIKVGCNRAFYNNTNGFDSEWQRGENIYLSKANYLKNDMK